MTDTSSDTGAHGQTVSSERFIPGLPSEPVEAIISLDSVGRITAVNEAALRLFGYRRDQLVGQSAEILFPGPPQMNGAGDLHAQRKDGSVFRADLRLGVIDAEPANPSYNAVVRDVTDDLAVLEAERASQATLRGLIDGAEVGFVLRSTERFLYVSPGFKRIWGYDPLSEEEAPADTLLRIHPDDRERVVAEYAKDSELGLTARAEFRILRADGEPRWVRATIAPVVGPQGVVSQFASTAEDITDRKVAEAALRSAHAETERANAAKSEFLSRASHELRTPLNAVLGFAQLLELDELTAGQRDAVQHILWGGRHLVGLIDDVLDIANIEAGRFEQCREPTRVGVVLTEAIRGLSATAAKRNVTIHYESGSDDPTDITYVQADRRRFEQVIVNLLSNAIKYNKDNGHVYVAHRVVDRLVHVTVRDTGHGIAQRNLARLFTPFDRLDAAENRIEGTGISLTLSLHLMNIMGGDLTAESTLDEGSTFTATLPRADH